MKWLVRGRGLINVFRCVALMLKKWKIFINNLLRFSPPCPVFVSRHPVAESLYTQMSFTVSRIYSSDIKPYCSASDNHEDGMQQIFPDHVLLVLFLPPVPLRSCNLSAIWWSIGMTSRNERSFTNVWDLSLYGFVRLKYILLFYKINCKHAWKN
jgi:hypothetical protein